MRSFPQTLETVLKQPFLTNPDWDRFSETLSNLLPTIGEGEAVLCAEKDPVEALAVFFAVVLNNGGAFFANPGWKKAEWKQVNVLTGFHKIFGCSAIEADPSRASLFDEARIMIPSGGTTNGIRFCVHTLYTLSSAVESLYRFHGETTLSSINPLPVFHVSGLMPVLRALLTGGLVELAAWNAIESGDFPLRPGARTSISLVPTQVARLVKMDKGLQFLHGFDSIYVGGARTPPGLVNLIRTEKLPVLFVYGMTETAAMVVAGTRAETDSLGGIWGQALPGVTIQLTDDQEVLLKTKALFRGYFPDDSEIQEYQTGDIGQWITTGLFQVLGRKDFLINTGGEKVNPEEVEAVLSDCLSGALVAVSSLPDDEWGDILVAVIEPDFDSADLDALRKTLEGHLASHKIPKRFITGKTIPRTVLGKVNRSKLRTLLLEE
jgi:O-succinylbenzoic acid--CoA ligase